jgi:hypothetical protein
MTRLRQGPGYNANPVPPGWKPENMRWTPIRLINRARYTVTVTGPTKAYIGWRWPLRWKTVVAPSSGERRIFINDPQWYFVRLQKDTWFVHFSGWRFLTVHWAADEGPVKFKGWVNLQEGLPPQPPNPPAPQPAPLPPDSGGP